MQGQQKSKVSTMKACGEVGAQRALGSNGKEVAYGPCYNRTLSMKVLKVNPSSSELVTLTKKEKLQEGGLICTMNEEMGCIKPRNEFGSTFNATLLEKVRLNDDTSKARKEFYPVLHRLLNERRNWGSTFVFHGLSTFSVFLMEWTKHILDVYKDRLKEAGIFGLAAISQFPYHYHKDVWKAFCEHWSPLTNTLHHGAGEVGISLMDLKQIGGLPILGDPYEEYLPPNGQLLDTSQYPTTVLELLGIHAELCRHHKNTEVSWHNWIEHFYRGKQRFYAYGEDPSSSRTKRSSPPILRDNSRNSPPLEISEEGELAAFLALLLSRFVLPTGSPSIRPETFVMACFMAQGRAVSIAPTVLGHIYHELGRIATHPSNPGNAEPHFGLHFIVGWLAEYFPCLYPCRSDDEFNEDVPSLAKYAGVLGHPLDLYQARLVFRGIERVSYRAVHFGSAIGDSDHKEVDVGELSDQSFEQLITIRSAVLPVRFGANLLLQPYYPNRFARQFGFDQGVPVNSLRFAFARRSRRSLEDIALAYARLFRQNTGTLFHIPESYHVGTYTSNYCRWWARISAPYLTQSCHKVRTILSGNKKCIEREPLFNISDSRIVVANIRGAMKVSDWHSQHSVSPPSVDSSTHVHPHTSAGTRKIDQVDLLSEEESPNADIHFKRIRYNKPPESDHRRPTETLPDFSVNDNPPIDDEVPPHESSSLAPIGNDAADAMTERLPLVQPSSNEMASLVVAPFPEAPTDLQTWLPTTMNHWIRGTLISGITHVADILSKSQSAQELLSAKPSIFQTLEGLEALVVTADVDLTWFGSRVRALFDNVEYTINTTSAVDVAQVERLTGKLAELSAQLESKQAQLSSLESQWSLDIQKQEKELLALQETVRAKELNLESSRAKWTTDRAAMQRSILQAEQGVTLVRGELGQVRRLAELQQKESNTQALTKEIISLCSSP